MTFSNCIELRATHWISLRTTHESCMCSLHWLRPRFVFVFLENICLFSTTTIITSITSIATATTTITTKYYKSSPASWSSSNVITVIINDSSSSASSASPHFPWGDLRWGAVADESWPLIIKHHWCLIVFANPQPYGPNLLYVRGGAAVDESWPLKAKSSFHHRSAKIYDHRHQHHQWFIIICFIPVSVGGPSARSCRWRVLTVDNQKVFVSYGFPDQTSTKLVFDNSFSLIDWLIGWLIDW